MAIIGGDESAVINCAPVRSRRLIREPGRAGTINDDSRIHKSSLQHRNENKLSPSVATIAISSISRRDHVTTIITDHVTQGALQLDLSRANFRFKMAS